MLVIILGFIFLYANLVAAYNAYLYIRRSAKDYADKKLKRNRRQVPPVRKDAHRPYINMDNPEPLNVPTLLVKAESSDFPTSYFDRF